MREIENKTPNNDHGYDKTRDFCCNMFIRISVADLIALIKEFNQIVHYLHI